MGAWGTAIDENDTYLDIKAEFEEMYHNGNSLAEIYKEFIGEDDFDFEAEETYEWWFAVADILWHYKALDEKVLSFVKKIVDSKKDLNYWQDLGGEHEEINQREIDLNNFIKRISKPKIGVLGLEKEDAVYKDGEPKNKEEKPIKEQLDSSKKRWDNYTSKDLQPNVKEKKIKFFKWFRGKK